jgi:parallel beta-helix repeat protein
LEHAASGARIEVLPGVYREGLVIDQPVQICGAGPAEDIVIESAMSACVLMRAAEAEIRGLRFHCTAGLGEHRYYAVNIAAGELLLEHCHVVSNSLAGIAVHGQHTRPTIRHCVVRNSDERGIIIYNHASGLLESCDISGRTLGVRISHHASPVLRTCRVHDGRHDGVMFVEHGQGMLEDCEVSDNGHHGVSIRLQSSPVLRMCRVNRNGWNALSIADISSAVVEGCDLRQNGRTSWDIKESARPRVIRRNNRDVG